MQALISSILAILFLLPFPAHVLAAEMPAVEFFSPQGTVKGVRQVAARFSDQMVPFGEPRTDPPFDIHCPEKGQGRWADGRNWVFDFARDLPAGIQCEFRTRPGLTTLAQKEVQAQSFSFSTGGPAIRLSHPRAGSKAIDEEQVFLLVLDAEATEQTLLEHAFFSIQGIQERVGIRILKGEERKSILNSVAFRHFAVYMKKADIISIRSEKVAPEELPPFVLIQAKQRFPSGAEVRLVWGKGINSTAGVATDADQTLPFVTRLPFTASFSCTRERKDANCIPLLPMRLTFSAFVPWEAARQVALQGPGGKTYRPMPVTWYNSDADEPGTGDGVTAPVRKSPEVVTAVVFKGPFPENSSLVIEMPQGLRDDAGRVLSNADKFPLSVRTDHIPPLAKFSSRFGIIELNGDATLPVTLRNLEAQVQTRMLRVEENLPGPLEEVQAGEEKLRPRGATAEGLKGRLHKIGPGEVGKAIEWLCAVAEAGRRRSVLKEARGVKEFRLPKPGGPQAFEVVGLPLPEPGLYIVELESQILGSALLGEERDESRGAVQKNPLYVPTAALVTNLAVHFKRGREASLVWVTQLDNAEPVPAASVSINDCKGKEIWSGKTDALGMARIGKALPQWDQLPVCSFSRGGDRYYDGPQLRALEVMDGGLFVFARKADDMTLVHSGWDEGIESWRYSLPHGSYQGPVIAHTVMDRTLLRAGDTVHMKHLIRKHTTSGFAALPAEELPAKVVVEHQGSEARFEFPLKWDAGGIAETTMRLPPEVKLGRYNVSLKSWAVRKRLGLSSCTYQSYEKSRPSGYFRVEEFRVPLMKGLIQPPREAAVNPREIDVDLMVSYLAGGGASQAQVQLRSTVRPRHLRFEDYEEFAVANGPVREGIELPSVFWDEGGAREEEAGKPKVTASALTLAPSGALRTKIGPFAKFDSPQEIAAELEFRDPNGEVQTVAARIPLWTSRVLVGIKPPSWPASRESFRFHLLVLDLQGKPVEGVPVKAALFLKDHYTHRKRLIGGFYSYEHVAETKKIGNLCEGVTDGLGLVICQAKSLVSGNVIIEAQATDGEGNLSVAHRDLWVHGKGQWWFDVSDNDRIDLLPEKKSYGPGETAKFQVRMPFRSATVLVTTEREGVMEAFVKKLSGEQPVIEVPVKGNYAPNVYVSALCVRGRIAGVMPTAMVDLGKPAFKLGIAEIRVGWRDHELKVEVSPEREVYRIREKATVKLKVRTDGGKLPPRGTEVALAAVDEGLLELMPNNSWKLLEAMMARRGYEVATATAQMQVVGKRHYGLKALPPGGGGGKQTTRELFDTLLLWKAHVKLDAGGEASVEVPLNDSLTSFRIVAVANSAGLFGTGQAAIRTAQDLMLLSGLPPLVREGDAFYAGFTVRNAAQRPLVIKVAASATAVKALPPLSLSLQPGEAKEIGWDITVGQGRDSLSWEITAAEQGGEARDTLRVKQKVIAAVPVATYQATVARIKGSLAMEIEKPRDAQAGRGGIQIALKPKLAEGLAGITEYMSGYPYSCLEQQVSIAVALRDEALWSKVTALLPSHLDADGLLKYFPAASQGSDVLTAYVLAISAEARRTIPDQLAKSMTAGLTNFVNGRVIRYSSLPTADLAVRKMAALEALSRYQEIDPQLLSSISLEPNLWPTSAVLDWMSLLLRAKRLPARLQRLKEAEQIIRSRLNFQGTTMGFSTEKTDYLWWLMVNIDTNAVRSILTFLPLEHWEQDMPRLVQGALGRQHRGRWDTTVANAWGVLALEKFSRKFEALPVTGKTTAQVARQEKSLDWSAAAGGGNLMFNWPKAKDKLALTHQGAGNPWATIRSLAAIPLKEPLTSGYRIKKSLTPLSRREKNRWSSGDVVRVTLEIEAQADMTWVAVNDPVPAGATILGTGLGRDSGLLTRDEKSAGLVWPTFVERSFEAFRAYYDYAPKGKWTVEYTLRLNNSGSFKLPETRVEALYAPEMFGMLPNKPLAVGR